MLLDGCTCDPSHPLPVIVPGTDTERHCAGGKESLTKKSEETEKAQDMACERTSTTVKSSEVSSHKVKSTSEE